MKVTIERPKNTVDLFIENYKFVPRVYRNHIPPPNIGWLSLKFKPRNVDIILNTFESLENHNISSKFLERVSIEQANFIKKQISDWNKLAITKARKEERKLIKLKQDYNQWLSTIIENNTSEYVIDSTGVITDKEGNYLLTLCYTEIGLKFDQILTLIEDTRHRYD